MPFEYDIWQKLNTEKNDLFLYGTGNGADRVLDRLIRDNTPVTGIFASDGFVRDRYFRGYKVMSYSEAHRLYPFMTVLMCFGSKRREVMETVDKISVEHKLYAPDVPVYGDEIFDLAFYEKHKNELGRVRDMLSDELSVRTFDNIINFKLSGEIKYLRACETAESDFYKLIKKRDGTVFVDLGAYTGDTVNEFLRYYCEYSGIIALEPEPRNFRKLVANTAHINNISCFELAVSDRTGEGFFDVAKGRGAHESADGKKLGVTTVDGLLGGKRADIIKIDVEGNELKAIASAANTISEFAPALRVACYHRSEDIYTLPLAIKKIYPGYRVYMRHTPHIPAWDTEYFFIP